MRVLITGGTGLLGSALCYTASDDIDIVPLNSKSCDLKDYEASKKIISHLHSIAPFQAIIHCAARVGGLFRNLREPVQMLNDNLQINTNVLAIANELNINRVVCVLSTCIFPDKIDYPIKPDQLHDGKPHHSNEGYAYAKRMLEVACRAYNSQYNREFYCVVPTNIYGPGDNFDEKNSHVIPALIRKAVKSFESRDDFKISGSGEHLRQFIFSRDAANIIWWSLKNYTHINTPLMLVKPDSETSIKAIAQEINTILGERLNIVYDTSIDGGQLKKTSLDTEAQLIELGYTPTFQWTSLKSGLTEAIEWYTKNIN